MVDWHSAFDALFAMALLLLGWQLRGNFEAIKELKEQDKDLADRVEAVAGSLPGVYMRRDDFMAFAREIKESLLRIEHKVDGYMIRTNGNGKQ